MTTAIELLKLRRSGVARVAAVVLVLLCPLLCAGLLLAAQGTSGSQLAIKVAALLPAPGWAGYLALVGQVLSVAVLLAGGIVMSWSFGRESVDGTITGLFAVAVSRRRIAAGKLAAVLVWLALSCAGAVVVALAVGPLVVLGAPGPQMWAAVGQTLAASLLCAVLTAPFAWVASALRGYLPAIGALLGIVVVSQVVTALGAGAWWPYAAPGLWLGMGGAAAAATVGVPQLLLPIPVAALGAGLTLRWWKVGELA